MADAVRSLSVMVFESLPSRSRIAAAEQSVSRVGHRRVREASFRRMVLWVERNRWTAQPELSARSLSATYDAVASTRPIPF